MSAKIYKLLCSQNPRALGIENDSGAWNLAKFEAHLKTCKVCARGKTALKRDLKLALKKVFAHGGRRKGAGRPPRAPEPLKRINVTLTQKEIARARWLGKGKVSLGIARALETCPELVANFRN